MVPFYDNKEDKEMIHLTHFLKTLVNVADIRPCLSSKFMLPELRKNKILEKIEGVIDQRVEEVDDDFFLENNFLNVNFYYFIFYRQIIILKSEERQCQNELLKKYSQKVLIVVKSIL